MQRKKAGRRDTQMKLPKKLEQFKNEIIYTKITLTFDEEVVKIKNRFLSLIFISMLCISIGMATFQKSKEWKEEEASYLRAVSYAECLGIDDTSVSEEMASVIDSSIGKEWEIQSVDDSEDAIVVSVSCNGKQYTVHSSEDGVISSIQDGKGITLFERQ